jgi:choline dehydrogenase-like flavoprotein
MTQRVTYDVVVLGGGPAGCVIASRLSEDPARSVCLIEAGPDHGAFSEGRWPDDLLYANELATSHDWGIAGGWSSWRAKVIGGCSAHNGCFIAWGSRADFDGWEEAGNEGWSANTLEPYRRRAMRQLRVRPSRIADLEPFMSAGLDAAVEIGLPLLSDFDDPESLEGAAPILVNAVGDVRWNAAFAYLDPARGRGNLTIIADALVDRLRLQGDQATAAFIRVDGEEVEIVANAFVLTAGAYGSPAILLRSGVGPADDLRARGVAVTDDLPGVGRNLIDHPRTDVAFRPTDDLLVRTAEHIARRPDRAQTLIKARSDRCPSEAWDLHLVMRVRPMFSDGATSDAGGPVAHFYVHVLDPQARGRVRIVSPDPAVLPVVEHGFLTDDEGHDRATLIDGIGLARRLAGTRALGGLVREELVPGPLSETELTAHLVRSVGGYWHPVGTCKMGPANDPLAVVDARGLVRGYANVWIADASIIPSIPRANTHLPVIAVAERIADLLAER